MKKFHFFSILLLMLALVPQVARAEYYGIKVGGVSVTSDNCDNITGENIKRVYSSDNYWVRYEPSTKTLTLHNIKIERKGSGNRAILNESCDGLTIVFEGGFNLSSQDASPIRLNANTTITSTKGLYGRYTDQYNMIWSWNSDAITVSNGAQLVISDIQLDVSSTDDAAFLGGTGSETIILVDALVETSGMLGYGMRNIKKLGIQNSSLIIKSKYGVENLKEFTLVGKERMTVLVPDEHYYGAYGQPTTTPVYYSETEQTFLSSEDNSKANNVAILSYIPINEETFPDETFRGYVSEKIDGNSNGELDFLETIDTREVSVYDKGISSLQGIEHLHFLTTLECRLNNLTRLNFASEMTSLSSMNCSLNQLTQLDLTKCPKLEKLDCSNNNLTVLDFSNCNIIHDISIHKNNINEWMTETLESLPEITENSTQWSDGYNIIVSKSATNDNVCTGEQADIARNKGWNVTVGGLDEEGNVVFDLKVGGNNVTSGNCDDLTVLPGVTKNNVDGYAYYNPTTQMLCLSGVDIVNEDGEGIKFEIVDVNPTIELGQEPVSITAQSDGIYYRNGRVLTGTLTITTKESDWYSEKLTIVSTEGRAIHMSKTNCIIKGVAHVEAKKTVSDGNRVCLVDGDLTIAEDAELRLKALQYAIPLIVNSLTLQDDNIIVTPAEATLVSGSLRDAEGKTIYGKEVVIGKLRTYNYYVAGTQITNANQHAVLGDTTIVFQEPARLGGPGTLVLNNANIDAGSEIGITAGKTLYFKLLGENNVSSTASGLASQTAYIEGPGSLNISGQYGIDAHLSKLFISNGAQITAEGSTRYAIDGKETTISGKETVVKMKCSPDARGTFRASTSLTLEDGLMIESPAGAQYADGEIMDADGNVIKDEWVTIQYTEAYDITVAGIGVTNHNMNDVLGDGTVSYDPETNTLTLNDANIETTRDIGLLAKRADLKVNLIGENSIRTSDVPGLQFRKASEDGPVTFMGGGSLNVTSDVIGMQLYIDAVLTDGVQVTVESTSDTYAALQGRNSGNGLPTITVSGEGTVLGAKGGTLGSVANFSALVLGDGIEIVEPDGASFVENIGIIANGTLVANEWVTIHHIERYKLYIAGTQVTSLNAEDVLGDGTVSFDPETSTLTLNNANITSETKNGINALIPALNIHLEGENNVASSLFALYGVLVYIDGTGSLYAMSTDGDGIYVAVKLTISGGAQVKAESASSYGIHTVFATFSGVETVVSMKGAQGAYYGQRPQFEDELNVVQPQTVYYNDEVGTFIDFNGNYVIDEWLTIKSFLRPLLYVAGIEVTSLNAADVLGDGTVCYDTETHTLTLTDANIAAEGWYGIGMQYIDGFSIKLIGENRVIGDGNSGIVLAADATIEGPGSLFVQGKNGIYTWETLTIGGGANVLAEGFVQYGIYGNSLTVSGEGTIVTMKGTEGAYHGSELTLEDGLVLGMPVGANFSDGSIVDAEGNAVAGEWVVIASQDYIDGVSNVNANLNLNEGIYNLAGQKVGEDYKGIVITNGRKLLKK